MKELSITQLAKILNARIDAGRNAQDSVRAISIDSRTVQPGDCFFAIAGENFDGHNYIADVFAKGASCAVVSKDISIDSQQLTRSEAPFRGGILLQGVIPESSSLGQEQGTQQPSIDNRHSTFDNYSLLKVDDTIKALGLLAAWYRKDCKFKVVAITGSAGKTTTRQIVHHVLSPRFKTHQPTKNFNNFIGLPLSILAAPPDTQILILELATNHPGEIEYLSRIAAPDIALITNVHPAHLAGFGSIENIAKEKLSISEGLRPDGILIINADCPPLIDFARKANLTFKPFSASKLARDLTIGPISSRFDINGLTVEIPLPGWGNLENALAAWTICSQLGISERDFADAVKTITPVSMRCEILDIGGLTVISDCYNANPASMQNALDILARLAKNKGHRAIFICGDMAELGIDAEKFHAELGRLIAGYNVSLLLTAGPLAALAADAAKQVRPGLQTSKFSDSAKLADNLHQFIKDSDIILVKGSRINKLEIVIEKLKELRVIK